GGRECANEIAVAEEALLFHTQQRGHERCRATFYILRPAAIEVAVLLGELERIERPVARLCLDHIEVREEHHRLLRSRAAIPNDQVSVFRRWPDALYVRLGKDRVLEANLQLLGDRRRVPR